MKNWLWFAALLSQDFGMNKMASSVLFSLQLNSNGYLKNMPSL